MNKNIVLDRLSLFVLAILFASFFTTGCSDDNKSGACLVGAGITQGCADGNSGECSLINGSYQGDGTSCAELGFTSN